MFCKACGTKVDDDSKFCKECGTSQGGISRKPHQVEVCQIDTEKTNPRLFGDKRQIRFLAKIGVEVIAETPFFEIHTTDWACPKTSPTWINSVQFGRPINRGVVING